jgi:AraC-like DNA-binding protein
MLQTSQDIHILGDKTQWRACYCGLENRPDWLSKAANCPELKQHDIAHCGIMKAQSPFEIVRYDQSGTFMLLCLGGAGEIICDGRWKKIRTGYACLLPPWNTNAFRAISDTTWEFVWVRYTESRERNPIISCNSPTIGKFEVTSLKSAIDGLFSEAITECCPSTMKLWINLIHSYVMRFAKPHQMDDKLWKLWRAVESSPSFPWSLNSLSEKACMSREHLRRVSSKVIGRSPMQQVTFIRLEIASRMISTTDEKIEAIAAAVGFSSVQSFTTTFHKWMGRKPSDFRRS